MTPAKEMHSSTAAGQPPGLVRKRQDRILYHRNLKHRFLGLSPLVFFPWKPTELPRTPGSPMAPRADATHLPPTDPSAPQHPSTDDRVRMRLYVIATATASRVRRAGGEEGRGRGLWAGRGEVGAGSRAACHRWRGGDWELWVGVGSPRTRFCVSSQRAVAASARRQVRKGGLGSWVGGGCGPWRSRALRAMGRAATRRCRGAPARARGPWLTRWPGAGREVRAYLPASTARLCSPGRHPHLNSSPRPPRAPAGSVGHRKDGENEEETSLRSSDRNLSDHSFYSCHARGWIRLNADGSSEPGGKTQRVLKLFPSPDSDL